MIKRIHINQHNIKHNAKHPNDLKDVITVKTSKNNHYGSDVILYGTARLVYSPNKPLSCGAKVWIETEDKIHIKNKDNKIIEL